jgi:hypothetical protein
MNKMNNTKLISNQEGKDLEMKIVICPFYGTVFCEEDCPPEYESCNRLKELTKGYKIK